MPTTSPEKIVTPAPSDAYALTTDLRTMMASARTVVPVANVTEADAIRTALTAAGTPASPSRPLIVLRADAAPAPRIEWHDGTRWHVTADTLLGRARLTTSPTTVAGTPAWTTLASVTATSLGGPCSVRADVTLLNANSGAVRVGSFRVTVDGTALTTPAGVDIYLDYVAGVLNLNRGAAFEWESTPAAGEHTWALQANGSAASSVQATQAVLTVTEQP